MFDRLWFRLFGVMMVALALAVGTAAVLMNRATSESFVDYVEEVTQARVNRVESVLSRHYQRNGSWAGVEPVVQLVADLAGQRVILADSSGIVVADSQPSSKVVGLRVQPTWAGEPVVITHQEQPVGSVYLDPLRPAKLVDTRGQAFLSTTNQYILWAAAVGLLAALILSVLLSRWLASPLEALTRAARRMERGDLGQQIDVRIGGEVGALARAFTSTAASLARLERLRKQMVTDIAHELRTPLTNVRGYLEGIQDGVVEPDEQTLGIMQQELAQLTRLVDDLQELALVEAGQLNLSRQVLDLRQLIQHEVLAVTPQADAAGVALATRLEPDVPELSVDAGRLGQVLGNLLRNALTHTPAGGRITVSLDHEGREAVIRVRDTGSGIAAEHLPHVFERFYRGDQARSRQSQGGYGLGLTISRELVQAHGGQISVESTAGQGTVFAVRLPLEETPPSPLPEAPTPEAVPPSLPRRSRLELLRTGVLVGGLFGGTAGLVEAALVALNARKLQSFAELFGYAVLIDSAVFGLLGGVATVVAAGAARLLGRHLDLFRLVAVGGPIGCVLVGIMAYLRWKQLYNPDDSMAAPQATFAQVVILGAAAWVALVASALLAPRGGSKQRALAFSRRLAPAALTVLVMVSAIGVARDLEGRGLSLSPQSLLLGAPRTSDGLAAEALASEAPPTAGPADEAQPPVAGGEAIPTSAATAVASPARAVIPPKGPNVLLVTIDSLRDDHVGAAGYGKARTPTLDRLAREGVRFSSALANQPDTNAAHATIFTGVYPATHGLRSHLVDTLAYEGPTLAETLGAQGYATAGVFSWLSLESAFSGLSRGFKVYSDLTVNLPSYLADTRTSTLAATYSRLKTVLALPGAMDRQTALSQQVEEQLDGKANVTTVGALDWLQKHQARSRSTGQPFFLWVHYFDPHYPYTPPAPFDQIEPDDCGDCFDGSLETVRRIQGEQRPDISPAQLNRLLQYYDGEVAFTDRELGRLLQGLKNLGVDDNTIILVVGDHGESFGEHGYWFHGGSLHDAEVHVPLIVRWSGLLPAGLEVDAVAQQVDIMPTLLELLGLPIPERVEGRSLAPLVRDRDAGVDRVAITELGDRSVVSIVSREWRLLKNTQSGAIRLYRVNDDPDDLHDLADAEPEKVQELEALLQQWREAHP